MPLDRLLLPRRIAEVVVVRRLPARARLPDARRPVSAGQDCRWSASSPSASSSTRSRTRSKPCTRATCCVRWSCCERGIAHRPRRHVGHIQPRRRHLGRRQQRLGRRRRLRGRHHRRCAHRGSRSSTRSPARNVVAVIVTHGHDDHVTVAPELAEQLHTPILLHPGDDVLWKMSHPEEQVHRNLDANQRIGCGGHRDPGHPHAGSLTGLGVPVHARGGCIVLRRHTVQRRSRRHRSVLQRLPHDHRLDPRLAARPCPRRRVCTPATVTTPPSVRRHPISPSGSLAATDIDEPYRQVHFR